MRELILEGTGDSSTDEDKDKLCNLLPLLVVILSIFIRQKSTGYVNVNDCSRFNFIQRLGEFSKFFGSMIFTLF